MKHFFVFIFSLSICSFVEGQTIEGEKPFRIAGTIDDTTVDTVFFRYYRCEKDNSLIKDTIPVTNGVFTIEGVTFPHTNAFLSFKEKEINFLYDPGEMQLNLKMDSLENFVLEGSQTQADRKVLEAQTKPLEGYLSEIKKQLSSEQSEENRNLLTLKKDSIDDLIENIRIHFITSHPDSYYSLDMFFWLLYNKKQSADMLMELFAGLSENVRKSCPGKEIYSYISQRKKPKMTNVSSLEAFNKEETLVRLSDFEGKYILIDFWASWCIPCIKGFPHLKELYAKYKDKGFTVISISIDNEKDEQKWLDAIEAHDITEWIHILSCKNKGENNICDLYLPGPAGSGGIPHQILIDESGNIIKRWSGFSDETAKEQDDMFERFFENKE
ncbi:MAG: AhpC/TSA family protein [Tannerella sp.]|jgi:thiol-disulfide isomerase/thioredoxin|nr:AhpC/TSA family protein [Tannerella sp.]